MSKPDDETKPIALQPTASARALQHADLLDRAFAAGEAAVDRWGLPAHLDQLVEESAELIVATNHWRRGRDKLTAVIEELADVIVVGAGVLAWLDKNATASPDQMTASGHRGFVLAELRLAMKRKLDRLDDRIRGLPPC